MEERITLLSPHPKAALACVLIDVYTTNFEKRTVHAATKMKELQPIIHVLIQSWFSALFFELLRPIFC